MFRVLVSPDAGRHLSLCCFGRVKTAQTEIWNDDWLVSNSWGTYGVLVFVVVKSLVPRCSRSPKILVSWKGMLWKWVLSSVDKNCCILHDIFQVAERY